VKTSRDYFTKIPSKTGHL